jgi:hypothetical protein
MVVNCNILGIQALAGKAFTAEQCYSSGIPLGNRLTGADIINVGRINIPIRNRFQTIEHQALLTPDSPMSIRQPFFIVSTHAKAFLAWVKQFDAMIVNRTKQEKSFHKALRPMAMGLEKSKQTYLLGRKGS